MIFNIGEQEFDIDENLLSKYEESLLAKCILEATDIDEILVDRDPKYFKKILEFMNDPSSLPVHRMSNIELDILTEEAKFYGIEELARICQMELGPYEKIDTVSGPEVEEIFKNETRYIILLQDKHWLATYNQERGELMKMLPHINRDKCLLIGFDYCDELVHRHKMVLRDPRNSEYLKGFMESECEALSYCVYLAHSASSKIVKWCPDNGPAGGKFVQCYASNVRLESWLPTVI